MWYDENWYAIIRWLLTIFFEYQLAEFSSLKKLTQFSPDLYWTFGKLTVPMILTVEGFDLPERARLWLLRLDTAVFDLLSFLALFSSKHEKVSAFHLGHGNDNHNSNILIHKDPRSWIILLFVAAKVLEAKHNNCVPVLFQSIFLVHKLAWIEPWQNV